VHQNGQRRAIGGHLAVVVARPGAGLLADDLLELGGAGQRDVEARGVGAQLGRHVHAVADQHDRVRHVLAPQGDVLQQAHAYGVFEEGVEVQQQEHRRAGHRLDLFEHRVGIGVDRLARQPRM
jgi:hypothetical protein